jgi:hypothetical protein
MTKISGGEGEAERDLSRREVSGRHEMAGVGLIGHRYIFHVNFSFFLLS